MTDDRTETTTPHTTVIERRGSGGTMLIGLAVLIAVIAGAFFLFSQNQNEAIETKAVTEAAQAIEGTAEKAGDAIDKAVPAE